MHGDTNTPRTRLRAPGGPAAAVRAGPRAERVAAASGRSRLQCALRRRVGRLRALLQRRLWRCAPHAGALAVEGALLALISARVGGQRGAPDGAVGGARLAWGVGGAAVGGSPHQAVVGCEPYWRDVLATGCQCQCQCSMYQVQLQQHTSEPLCVHYCMYCLVSLAAAVANAPYILGPAAIRYRHVRCGQQTAFGLLLPLRCVCHTSLRSLRSGSCTCLERDHACILAAPVGLD